MKIIKVDLGSDLQGVDIVPFSDLHSGSGRTAMDKARALVERIRTTENLFTIINGDMMETALKTSLGNVYEQSLSPAQQADEVTELLMPIRHKILAMTTGNHEARITRATGLDLSLYVAERLGLGNRYTDGNYMLFVSFGRPAMTRESRRHTFSIYGTHGAGGGKLIGGKMNALGRMAGVVDADIYLHSHTHVPATYKEDFYRSDMRTRTVRQVTKLFVNSNAWMEFGGYGEIKGYKPATITPVTIKLRAEGSYKYANCEL
jgi:hypothetical protein